MEAGSDILYIIILRWAVCLPGLVPKPIRRRDKPFVLFLSPSPFSNYTDWSCLMWAKLKTNQAGGFRGRSAIVQAWNLINPAASQCELASAEEVFHCSVCVGISHHIWSPHNRDDTDSKIRIQDCLKEFLPLVKLNTTSVWGYFFLNSLLPYCDTLQTSVDCMIQLVSPSAGSLWIWSPCGSLWGEHTFTQTARTNSCKQQQLFCGHVDTFLGFVILVLFCCILRGWLCNC